MSCYINCIKQFASLSKDLTELIPDRNLRRRMSRVVKMGVSTGLESLLDFEPLGSIDAVITATGLGCIADSEKFLGNFISSGERLLTPTPFINSPFNTVGAQIALIKSLHCYNNTFSHRYTGFESALTDAMLRIKNGRSGAVLTGVFEEITPTVQIIMKRMGLLRNRRPGEGAVFFVLTGKRLDSSVAVIEDIAFGVSHAGALPVSRLDDSLWCGAVANAIVRAVGRKYNGYIVNDIDGKNNSLIKLRCF